MDYAKLNESLKDEYNDVIKYVGFFKKTDNAIFRDIAREEYVHAKHLKDILTESGKLDTASDLEEKAKAALDDV
jgi:rubrerythrin